MGERGPHPRGEIIEHRVKTTGDYSFSIRYQVGGKRRQRLVCRTSDPKAGRAHAEAILKEMRDAWGVLSLEEAERKVLTTTLEDRLAAWIEAQGATVDQVAAALRRISRRGK